jgi:predicted ATPase
VTTLSLRRLGRDESGELVRGIMGDAEVRSEVVEEIVERTDGVPLFLEELTKAILETAIDGREVAAVPPAPLAVPATLHAPLMARLDRLGSAAKEIAQMGAAIGREFSYELLAVIAQRTESELRVAVSRLVGAGLVFQRGTLPQATFLFKHALVQDAARSTLLRAARQRLHGRIAEALKTHSPELMDSQPELLAQHYAEAGLVKKSVACWAKAGHRSIARSAMAEAAAQFQKGLDQLARLADSPQRQRRGLELLSSLCAVLQAAKGYASPETGQAYSRARELWEQLGSSSEFLQVPYGQSLYHVTRGEIDLALRLDNSLVALSRARDDAAGLVLGYLSSGRHLTVAGQFARSRSHLEQALALYDPISHQTRVQHAVVHPQVALQADLGNVLVCLGFSDQAVARSNAAIAGARRLAHLPSLAASLVYGARLHSLVGDNIALDQLAHELVELTTERGFPHWGAQGSIYCGWVRVRNGDVTEGIALLRNGMNAYRATGAGVWMTYHMALLAKACEIASQAEEAVTLLDEALQIVEKTGERWFSAELNRHKGQLLLRQGHSEAAQELYRKALGIAEAQDAKLWELRAAVSLGRSWRDQGKRAEARDLIAPIYGWFTEGFDTPDLKEAKALLEELGRAAPHTPAPGDLIDATVYLRTSHSRPVSAWWHCWASRACRTAVAEDLKGSGREIYSITSSARARIDGGIVRPSALAVFRLTIKSNLVGCSTGRSAGLAPLRILST